MAARRALKSFWRDDSGATAVEIGVIVVLISITLLAAYSLLGNGINVAFTKTAAAIGT